VAGNGGDGLAPPPMKVEYDGIRGRPGLTQQARGVSPAGERPDCEQLSQVAGVASGPGKAGPVAQKCRNEIEV